jgi:IS1 family transposase
MNRLSLEQKTRVIAAIVEGNSIRSTVRMTGVAKNSVIKLVLDLANACAEYHDKHVRALRVRRLQCDEIWAFVGAKMKNATPDQKAAGWGDVWTWTAIDADTKLCVSYLVGGRDTGWATDFMWDCRQRIVGRPQITTDAHKPYMAAVEMAFGDNVDYAQLHKIYGASNEPQTRYSPATCIGTDMKTVSGEPDPRHVSTSYVERQNLSMRMGIRRFTRLTNGFSKKIENHSAAVALWFAYYNFCRVHSSIRVTPAMEAKITNHVWTIEELVGLLQCENSTTSKIDNALFRKALGDAA